MRKKIKVAKIKYAEGEVFNCIECSKITPCETDIQLCSDCMKKFDTDRLWKLHDKNKIDALDFNESKTFREQFRVKI
jgi:hypothetical protein